MNPESRHQWRPAVVVLAAVALIATGAAATYVVMKRAETPPARVGGVAPASPSVAGPESRTRPTNDRTVTFTPEALKRAGIEVQAVSQSSAAGRVRVPGTVQPKAYRTTVVTSLVGGRITRVPVELGQTVRRGQTLAEVYSPELAEAQTRFIAARAELDAHDRELRRTERLVEIGAASRQELERIHAEHTTATTTVQSHRSRLTLFGVSEGQIAKLASGLAMTPTVSIPSPLDGVVTTREANPGMNVDPSAPLFTVADLSTVWIVGDLNERDLAGVRIGSPVIITTASIPGATREGKVGYIDPQIKADTRSAQVRVEITNPGQQLRLGMYVDMELGEGGSETAMIVPRSAVQIVGNRSVVYVAVPGQAGRFIQRVIETGQTVGDAIQVLSGLTAGDVIVTRGSFAVRSEAEKLGIGSLSRVDPAEAGPHVVGPGFSQTSGVKIIVSEKGFEPARLSVRPGVPARLTFLRTTDATCATEVAIPSLKITRALPLNEPVEIVFTPEKPGEIAFACGMAMFSGSIVVQ